MTPAEVVIFVKRHCKIGQISVTSDRVTQDILDALNITRFRIWRKYHWSYLLEEISETVGAGDTGVTFPSTIGQLLLLYFSNRRLKSASFKEYYDWLYDATSGRGTLTHYIKIGKVASTGAIKIRLYETPSTGGTLTGWGKIRLDKYTVSDLTSADDMTIFPVEMHDVIAQGTYAIILKQKDKNVGLVEERNFWKLVTDLIRDDSPEPDVDLQMKLPDNIRWKRRQRGGTSVV